MSLQWYEVWADESLAPPYFLLVVPDERTVGGVIILDPRQGLKVAYAAPSYESAKDWLLEDEYTRVVTSSQRRNRNGTTVGITLRRDLHVDVLRIQRGGDKKGRLIVPTQTDRNGRVTNFSFDGLGRLKQEQWVVGVSTVNTHGCTSGFPA